jgi:hypothetical protein
MQLKITGEQMLSPDKLQKKEKEKLTSHFGEQN